MPCGLASFCAFSAHPVPWGTQEYGPACFREECRSARRPHQAVLWGTRQYQPAPSSIDGPRTYRGVRLVEDDRTQVVRSADVPVEGPFAAVREGRPLGSSRRTQTARRSTPSLVEINSMATPRPTARLEASSIAASAISNPHTVVRAATPDATSRAALRITSASRPMVRAASSSDAGTQVMTRRCHRHGVPLSVDLRSVAQGWLNLSLGRQQHRYPTPGSATGGPGEGRPGRQRQACGGSG